VRLAAPCRRPAAPAAAADTRALPGGYFKWARNSLLDGNKIAYKQLPYTCADFPSQVKPRQRT